MPFAVHHAYDIVPLLGTDFCNLHDCIEPSLSQEPQIELLPPHQQLVHVVMGRTGGQRWHLSRPSKHSQSVRIPFPSPLQVHPVYWNCDHIHFPTQPNAQNRQHLRITRRHFVDEELFFMQINIWASLGWWRAFLVQWAWQECGGASFVTNNRALGPTDLLTSVLYSIYVLWCAMYIITVYWFQ